MTDDKLSGAIQENVLTLLAFSDEYCKLVRHALTPSLFENSIYRDIAGHAIDFIDQFGTAIKDHLPDVLEGVLKGSDARKAASYTRVLDNLFQLADSVNGEYVVSKLNEFVRGQAIKSAIVRAVEAVEGGDVAAAEVALQQGLASQINVFERGMLFSDPKQSLGFLDSPLETIPTGIEELDKRGVGPAPKELFLIIAPPKKGKSWGLIHLGKFALLNRKRVLHVTLEMSEERVAQRYIQSFFGVSKRDPEVRTPKLKVDAAGRLMEIEHESIQRWTFGDEKIRAKLASRLERDFRKRPPLVIKQFPTGSLSISGLKAYMDGLERFHKFIPDLLVLDYPDLMTTDGDNLRISTNKVYEGLRGIAVERNIAVAAASQGNRSSAGAKLVTDAMVAESFGKIATADNVITYNQTDLEKKAGLARLFVSNGRNDEDKFTVLITQSYASGQFCLESTLMLSDYWRLLESREEGDDDEE